MKFFQQLSKPYKKIIKKFLNSLELLKEILTIITILFAGIWFLSQYLWFPRVELKMETTVNPIDVAQQNYTYVRLNVFVKNIGLIPFKINDNEAKLYQITPIIDTSLKNQIRNYFNEYSIIKKEFNKFSRYLKTKHAPLTQSDIKQITNLKKYGCLTHNRIDQRKDNTINKKEFEYVNFQNKQIKWTKIVPNVHIPKLYRLEPLEEIVLHYDYIIPSDTKLIKAYTYISCDSLSIFNKIEGLFKNNNRIWDTSKIINTSEDNIGD